MKKHNEDYESMHKKSTRIFYDSEKLKGMYDKVRGKA